MTHIIGTFSTECCYAQGCYSDCHILVIVMLCLHAECHYSVVMLSVFMLSVVAPPIVLHHGKKMSIYGKT